MLSVDEAIHATLKDANALGVERVPLTALPGRVAASDVIARITQPPFSASAMDGYAVRFQDAQKNARLKLVGETPAGSMSSSSVNEGEAVRIFTGAPVPDGANHVVIQEDTKREGDEVLITEAQDRARNIRQAGVDFHEGDVLVQAGDVLHEIHGAIIAAANIPEVEVLRRPRVVVFSNGDELKEPGTDLQFGQIINSNHYALCAMINKWGGQAVYIGRAPDDRAAVKSFFEKAEGADIIVPVGGASVGDYDFVKSAFDDAGGKLVFEKIAVRPGKPTWFGQLGNAKVLGLPGNPASAIVCAALFIQPLVRRLAGFPQGASLSLRKARLAEDLGANGGREAFLRAAMTTGQDGALMVSSAPNQDSSLLLPFGKANVLIRRLANAPSAQKGDEIDIVQLR
ncbi:MAG: molybdopterin molybdenumtransferase MoeA [Hyphococcus sp.]|nr:MAG: molybdopterin molybdenumtransferase MoeA [Marinicaulis sp.]